MAVDTSKVRNLQWHNFWMHKDWQDLGAMSLEAAGRIMQQRMPHSEDGTKLRDKDTKEEWNWTPPQERPGPGNNGFGPF